MKKLRHYQAVGFNDMLSYWEYNGYDVPIMFVLATGGGKTVTFVEVIREFAKRGKRCIMIAHRQELIEQSYKTLLNNGLQAGIIKADYPVRNEFNVQVASIQTLIRRTDIPDADLYVIDEAHHVTDSNSYGKILEKNNNATILMVTATPYRLDGSGFVNCIKDRKDTHLIVNSTIAGLIDDGWLVPFEYYIAAIPDLSGVKIVRGDYDEESAAEAMKLVPIVESYIKNCNGLQGICYCVNVEHSIFVAEQYNAKGIPAAHVDATTPKDIRAEIIKKFRNREILVVCNVGILTEGTDFPLCQFIQLARPTKSLSMFLQMVGRGTRASIPIDCYNTPDERKNAIQQSDKKHSIILDNCMAWEEHGFPDDDHDWVSYFRGGWKKKKEKKKDEEIIEIYEIIDSETGEHRTTKRIKDLEGHILVKVTKEVKKQLKLTKHLKKFETLLSVAYRTPTVKKKNYFAFFRFIEYCEKHLIEITEDMWEYLFDKCYKEPQKRYDNAVEQFKLKHPDGVPTMSRELEYLREQVCNKYFMQKKKLEYNDFIRKHLDTVNDVTEFLNKKLDNLKV